MKLIDCFKTTNYKTKLKKKKKKAMVACQKEKKEVIL